MKFDLIKSIITIKLNQYKKKYRYLKNNQITVKLYCYHNKTGRLRAKVHS